MAYDLATYEAENGWSSELFAKNAVPLIKELQDKGLTLVIHRTVIHIRGGRLALKAYVHHNGRTPEYATITNWRGHELATFHHTEFDKLRGYVLTNV